MAECPLFLVWCAEEAEIHQNTETFLLSTVDAALAAQNAAVAAEALGLGIVYIGGIRNNPDAVAELLKLPKLVYPVFGMCVGVPAQRPDIRPRLPMSAVYHHETYTSDEQLEKGINSYDEIMSAYYTARSGGARTSDWSREMASRLGKENRGHMLGHLERQGFRLL